MELTTTFHLLKHCHNKSMSGSCRFTLLHSPNEMRRRNVDALKTLLGLCQAEPESLANAWNAVLKCISTLEYITTTPFFAGPPGPNQVSRDVLVLSLTELTGKPTEQVFVNSVKLPSDVIVEFFTALCAVSAEELNYAPPRVFSLTKLVEISYYNMTRIRMVSFAQHTQIDTLTKSCRGNLNLICGSNSEHRYLYNCISNFMHIVVNSSPIFVHWWSQLLRAVACQVPYS